MAARAWHRRSRRLGARWPVVGRLCATVVFLLCACGGPAVVSGPGAPPGLHEVVGSGGATAGPLRLRGAELVFEGGRADATVPRGEPLRAHAILRFDGSGSFRAAWEADGRPVAAVAFPVTYGNTVRVRTDPGTPLPTFEPGPHVLTLRVESPAVDVALPTLRYFVTAEPGGVGR